MLSALFSVTFSKGRGIWKCERKSNYQIRVALILWRAYLDQTESFCNYPPLCIGHYTFIIMKTLFFSLQYFLPIYVAPVWSQVLLPLSPVNKSVSTYCIKSRYCQIITRDSVLGGLWPSALLHSDFWVWTQPAWSSRKQHAVSRSFFRKWISKVFRLSTESVPNFYLSILVSPYSCRPVSACLSSRPTAYRAHTWPPGAPDQAEITKCHST